MALISSLLLFFLITGLELEKLNEEVVNLMKALTAYLMLIERINMFPQSHWVLAVTVC